MIYGITMQSLLEVEDQQRLWAIGLGKAKGRDYERDMYGDEKRSIELAVFIYENRQRYIRPEYDPDHPIVKELAKKHLEKTGQTNPK